MCRVEWRNSMAGPPKVVKGGIPKKPVVWIGAIWLKLPGVTKDEIDTRSWRSNKPLSCADARAVLDQLLTMLINEHGKDNAIDSGFWLQSR